MASDQYLTHAWFNASPNAYMVLDPNFHFVAANRAYCTLVGTSPDALIGHSLFELFPNDPEDPMNEPRVMLRESLEKVLRTRERDVLAYIPYRVPRAPGLDPELRVWSATHTPLLSSSGEVAAILQHTQDVTALRSGSGDAHDSANVLNRAEEVQRDLSELGGRVGSLLTSLEQSPGFMAMLRGPEHVFEFANRAYRVMLGHRELLGLPAVEAVPELAEQGYSELLNRVFLDGEPFVGHQMRIELERPEGEREQLYVDVVYQPIFERDGRPYGVLVQGHEVTKQVRATIRSKFRVRASEAMASAGTHFVAGFEGMAWAAVETICDWAIIDLALGASDRRIIVAHARADDRGLAEKVADHALVEPTAAHPLDSLQAAKLWALVDDATLTQIATDPMHLQTLRAIKPLSMIALPLFDGSRRCGVLQLFTAHTRQRLDDDDQVAVKELQGLISATLQSARLSRERDGLLASAEHARLRAEAASRAKDDFLAMLGHELRNPLSPILTAVDLMRGDADPKLASMLSIIERQAGHLVRLVDDMLDISRIERGKLEVQRHPIRAARFIERAIEMTSPLLEKKDHQLQVGVLPDVLVNGDEARLAQVVANLLSNSARYTPRGGQVELRVETDGNELAIHVIDNGIGISPDVLPRVFDMFVQGPQSVDRSRGGLGLGLTLVRSLVEMHDGAVVALSEGRGTEVCVTLPILEGEARPTPPRDQMSEADEKRRVVLVDDNVEAAEMTAALLRRAGHTIALAHDGVTGLQTILAERPDVAILDLGLPGFDGLELARRLRDELGDATPQLIALTGYGSEEDRERTSAAGFSAHVTKPARADTLLALL